jgi:hypothetical protein
VQEAVPGTLFKKVTPFQQAACKCWLLAQLKKDMRKFTMFFTKPQVVNFDMAMAANVSPADHSCICCGSFVF